MRLPTIEWPTVLLIVASYSVWLCLLFGGQLIHPVIWIVLMALNTTLFMSITHEVIHGHPTRNERVNALMLALPIAISIPFERFRDTHMAHHDTEELTDPFDDPESWYLAQGSWLQRNGIMRIILTFNNTLAGRMIIGPAIALFRFYASELALVVKNDKQRPEIAYVWSKHLVLCCLIAFAFTLAGNVSILQIVLGLYLGHSLLLVRTFLEHQAAPGKEERTVIIETACPLAFLFLFNNYHFIHHDQPGVPWYRLPGLYKANRNSFIQDNNGYLYRSYGEIFRLYFLRAKEPVPHPFLRIEAGTKKN